MPTLIEILRAHAPDVPIQSDSAIKKANLMSEQLFAYMHDEDFAQEGLWRLQGNATTVKGYKAQMEADFGNSKVIDNHAEDFRATRDDVITLYKQFLKEVTDCSELAKKEIQRIFKNPPISIQDTIKKLNEIGAYDEAMYLHQLMRFAKKAVAFEATNKMGPANFALMLDPNISQMIGANPGTIPGLAAAITAELENKLENNIYNLPFDKAYPEDAKPIAAVYVKAIVPESKMREFLDAYVIADTAVKNPNVSKSLKSLDKKIKAVSETIEKLTDPIERVVAGSKLVELYNAREALPPTPEPRLGLLRRFADYIKNRLFGRHDAPLPPAATKAPQAESPISETLRKNVLEVKMSPESIKIIDAMLEKARKRADTTSNPANPPPHVKWTPKK